MEPISSGGGGDAASFSDPEPVESSDPAPIESGSLESSGSGDTSIDPVPTGDPGSGTGGGGPPASALDTGGPLATDSFSDAASPSSSPSAQPSSSSSSRNTDATPMKAEARRDDQVRSDEVKRDQVQRDVTSASVQRADRATPMKAAPRAEETPEMAALKRDDFTPAPAPTRGMPSLQPSDPPAKAASRAEPAATMGARRRDEDTTKAEAPAPQASTPVAKAAPRGEAAATMSAPHHPEEDAPVRAENPAPVPVRSMAGYRQPAPAKAERAMSMSAPRPPEDASKKDTPEKAQTPSAPPREGPYKPGALWVAPKLDSSQIKDGKIDNAKFPDNKSPVTKPPDPMTAAVGIRPMTYKDAGGVEHTMRTPEEYKAQIAANRRAAGMPEMGGEPVEVHLAVQGGGGAGRRFPAALNEAAALGIAPGSFSGASAGGITAALMAAGATPAQLEEVVKDPALGGMQDWHNPLTSGGGAWAGQKAYDYFNGKLADLTGIHDRPVTFRDLPYPLQIVAMKAKDSAQPNLSNPMDRIFTFSQETTPDTPVALAVRASMSIPGGFDPVKATDPATGRKIEFMDGGVVDNLPMGYNHNNLPTLGLAPIYPKDTHPADHTKTPVSDSAWGYGKGWVANGWTGYSLKGSGATDTRDFRDRSYPGPNQFQLGVPVFSNKDPAVYDNWMKFGWEGFDPKLDQETRGITRDFMRSAMPSMGTPGAKATNTSPTVPRQFSMNQPFSFEGKPYEAWYSSSYLKGDTAFVRPKGGGAQEEFKLGRREIERMYLDDRNFGGNRFGSYMMDQLRSRIESVRAMAAAAGD